jgi:hypothetical protein
MGFISAFKGLIFMSGAQCVNKEVVAFNKNLTKLMKPCKNVTVV